MCSELSASTKKPSILIIEPFYGGSHKKLIDVLTSGLPKGSYQLITMSPANWHWRARSSALYVASQIAENTSYFEILICTSVLALNELLGLKPELSKLRKIIYFLENQLVYPVRSNKERDFQTGYKEILSCMSADVVLFNSNFNMESFLDNVEAHLNMQPDYIVKDVLQKIRPKCKVAYFPMDLSHIALKLNVSPSPSTSSKMKLNLKHKAKHVKDALHIVWPHRWEYDKDPQAFVNVLCKLMANKIPFKVSILGQVFNSQVDKKFDDLRKILKDHLLFIGYVDEDVYFRILERADVVISTAIHEFFGVAVMEAVYCGCIPVIPRRLAYLELYEADVDEMYSSPRQLYMTLRKLAHLKERGNVLKSYKYLAMPFDSAIWISNMIEIMYPFLKENTFPCEL